MGVEGTHAHTSMMIRPAGRPPMVMSKYTLGFSARERLAGGASLPVAVSGGPLGPALTVRLPVRSSSASSAPVTAGSSSSCSPACSRSHESSAQTARFELCPAFWGRALLTRMVRPKISDSCYEACHASTGNVACRLGLARAAQAASRCAVGQARLARATARGARQRPHRRQRGMEQKRGGHTMLSMAAAASSADSI